jgi:GNAT superfamily N-acetyltransferase
MGDKEETETTTGEIAMGARIPTRIPQLILRFARETDAELILDFIQELAAYERLSHEVVTDVKGLRQSLFGGRQVAEVVIAEYGDHPAGMALFFHTYSTFLGKPGLYLEDLYVKPAFRGRGTARTLLSFLARVAKERDCGRLEFSVLDWNEPAIRLYEKLGARAMDDWTVFRVAGKELDDLSGSFQTGAC